VVMSAFRDSNLRIPGQILQSRKPRDWGRQVPIKGFLSGRIAISDSLVAGLSVS